MYIVCVDGFSPAHCRTLVKAYDLARWLRKLNIQCKVQKRGEDDVFHKNGEEIRNRIYFDSEGTEYAVNWRGNLVYIAGEDWVI